MSGGSMDYLYERVRRALEPGNEESFKQDTPHRKAFAVHLSKIASALHDIEWVDSGDMSPSEEYAAIEACVGQDVISIEIIKAKIALGPEKESNKDVHTEHCCFVHGCKYGEEDCSVARGRKNQSYKCESCSEDEYYNAIR